MRIELLLALPQYGATIYLIALYQTELTFWMNVTLSSISTSSTQQKLTSQMIIKDNSFRLITTTNIKVKRL